MLKLPNVPGARVSEIGVEPFPFVAVDDCLEEETLRLLESNWPAPSSFYVAGHHQHDRRCHIAAYDIDDNDQLVLSPRSAFAGLAPSQTAFWSNFVERHLRRLGMEMIRFFFGYIRTTRGPGELAFVFDRVWLEDAPVQYAGHGLRVHTHYDHDPLWTVTCLIYLDDAEGSVSGTYAARYGPGFEGMSPRAIREVALNSRQWYADGNFQIAREMPFRRNRMFAFVDGPLSFHGVRPFDPRVFERGLRRRMVLSHITLRPEMFLNRYGVSHNQFQQAVMAHESCPAETLTAIDQDIALHLEAMRDFEPYGAEETAGAFSLKTFDWGSRVLKPLAA